jgi:hypothetical protein
MTSKLTTFIDGEYITENKDYGLIVKDTDLHRFITKFFSGKKINYQELNTYMHGKTAIVNKDKRAVYYNLIDLELFFNIKRK